jgi:hypothetical protein
MNEFIDNAQTQLASGGLGAYNSAKPYLPGSNTLLSALVGGGIGATLTGGAALASRGDEGESPAMRRRRVLREVLTGGGVGAAAGAALPTGVSMLSGMLPARTAGGRTAEAIAHALRDGSPAANALAATGAIPIVSSIFGKATGLYGAGKQHIQAQTADYLHRFGNELNAVQDKLRAETLAEVNAAHPTQQSGTPHPNTVAKLLASKMDKYAPGQMRSILGEGRDRFGKVMVPGPAGSRFGQPTRLNQLNTHAELLAGINHELNKVNPNMAAGYTGKMQPHWAGGFGRRFLPSAKATGIGALLTASPWLARTVTGLVSKVDPMLDAN